MYLCGTMMIENLDRQFISTGHHRTISDIHTDTPCIKQFSSSYILLGLISTGWRGGGGRGRGELLCKRFGACLIVIHAMHTTFLREIGVPKHKHLTKGQKPLTDFSVCNLPVCS